MLYSAWPYSKSLNPTQFLNLTTTLLTINKQQIRSLLRENSVKIEYVLPNLKCYQNIKINLIQ